MADEHDVHVLTAPGRVREPHEHTASAGLRTWRGALPPGSTRCVRFARRARAASGPGALHRRRRWRKQPPACGRTVAAQAWGGCTGRRRTARLGPPQAARPPSSSSPSSSTSCPAWLPPSPPLRHETTQKRGCCQLRQAAKASWRLAPRAGATKHRRVASLPAGRRDGAGPACAPGGRLSSAAAVRAAAAGGAAGGGATAAAAAPPGIVNVDAFGENVNAGADALRLGFLAASGAVAGSVPGSAAASASGSMAVSPPSQLSGSPDMAASTAGRGRGTGECLPRAPTQRCRGDIEALYTGSVSGAL